MLSDEELLALSREAFSDKQFVALAYDSGAYEITNPTVELQNFARAVERATIERCAKVCEKQKNWILSKQTNTRYEDRFEPVNINLRMVSIGASDCEIAIRAMLEEK